MEKRKRQRLEGAGWRVGSVTHFLGLSEEEIALVEVKLGLASAVRKQRSRRRMTQEQLGRLLGSSQSRVAKIEAADLFGEHRSDGAISSADGRQPKGRSFRHRDAGAATGGVTDTAPPLDAGLGQELHRR